MSVQCMNIKATNPQDACEDSVSISHEMQRL